MRFVAMALLVVCITFTCVGANELVFFDNFNDGNIDGWVTFGYEPGYQVWCQDSELWGKASSGSDCCHCPGCGAIAVVDDLICSDFTIEVKLTNHNSCGGFGLRLRLEEETWDSSDDMLHIDYWQVYFDPGYSQGYWEMGARVDGVWMPPGSQEGIASYSWGGPNYFRVVLHGQTMELWHRTDSQPDYTLINTMTASGGSTEGYVALMALQSAKQASFDDVFIYSHETPVEKPTWGRVKALYR